MRVIAGLQGQLPDSRPVLSGSRGGCLLVERRAHRRASPCPQRTVCGPVLRLEAARLWQEDLGTEPLDEAAGFITLMGAAWLRTRVWSTSWTFIALCLCLWHVENCAFLPLRVVIHSGQQSDVSVLVTAPGSSWSRPR